MRELQLIRRLMRSYHQLGLSESRLWATLLLMLATAVLEMSGLSVIYPLVLAVGGTPGLPRRLPAFNSATWLAADPRTQVLVLLVGWGLVNAIKNASLYFTYRYNISFAVYYGRHLTRALYASRLNQSLLEFRRESAGRFANIVCGQVTVVVDGVVRPMLVAATEACLLVGISMVVFWFNPLMIGAVLMACALATAWYYASSRDKALGWGKTQLEASALLQELVANTAAGASEIKVFGKEDFLTDKVYEAAAMKGEMFHKLEMHNQIPRFLIETVFVTVFVLLFSVSIVRGAELTVVLAQFAVVAAAALRILPSVNRLVGSYSNVSFNVAPALLLLESVGEAAATSRVSRVAHESLDQPAALVEFRDVGFTYSGEGPPILSHVSMIIERGDKVGVVGRSGSGKSTLLDILAGLYAPTQGEVFVNGEPMTSDVRAWHATLGYVPQVPFIMPGTIRDNVTFGVRANQHTDQEILGALERAGLRNFLRALPDGLDTVVGDRGLGLSGGQRQMICLARALLRRPMVLLLDEPTAALDPAHEGLIVKLLGDLPRTITVVMISHKAACFERFDRVFRCESGGCHAETHGQRAAAFGI